MWYCSIFGNLRYKWILKEMQYSCCFDTGDKDQYKCILDLDNYRVFDNYYTAWCIIFLMVNRVKERGDGCVIYKPLFYVDTKYILWKNMEILVEKLPQETNKKYIQPHPMQTDSTEKLWTILYIMNFAYNKINIETEIKFSEKLKKYLQLLEPSAREQQ